MFDENAFMSPPALMESTHRAPVTSRPAPSASRFVDARSVRLHCLDYGAMGRRPMLCVHGGAAHAHWFHFVAAAFTSDFHVHALDLRGHGDSEWADPPSYFYNPAGFMDAVSEFLRA